MLGSYSPGVVWRKTPFLPADNMWTMKVGEMIEQLLGNNISHVRFADSEMSEEVEDCHLPCACRPSLPGSFVYKRSKYPPDMMKPPPLY
jgi:hypothetical protein